MKLLLADDHTLFRDALMQYITRAEPSAKVILAKDFPDALAVMSHHPDQDLVLLDLRMPGMNGMEGFKTMRDVHPDVPVALMSGMAEPEDVRAAMALGAVGYFPKTLSGKALLRAIQLVLAGEHYMPLDHGNGGIMPAYYGDGPPPKGYVRVDAKAHAGAYDAFDTGVRYSLTPREHDVLSYLSRGDSNKDIANALGLQVVTVKLHVRGICRKLGVQNRTQAALIAHEKNIAG